MGGGTEWPEQVMTEFQQLLGNSSQGDGQQLIYIQNCNSIPVLFTDIFSDIATYEDRRKPSFSNRLVAKSLVRQTSNEPMIDYYRAVSVQLVDPDATASLRWIDVHKLQMPTICFAASAAATEPSYTQSYVVGNVMVVPPQSPCSSATNAGKNLEDTKVVLPRTAVDSHQKEKMERVDSWLKEEAHLIWMQKAAIMHEVDAAGKGNSRPANERKKVRDARAESKPNDAVTSGYYEALNACDKKGSCSSVKRQSGLTSSPQVPNPQQWQPPRCGLETQDMPPERDVNQHNWHQSDSTTSSSKNNYRDSHLQKPPISNSVPTGVQGKIRDCNATCLSVEDTRRIPLFTREQSATAHREFPSCSPVYKKTESEVHDVQISKHSYYDSTKFSASEVQQALNNETPPQALRNTSMDCRSTESDHSMNKSLDEENVACEKNRERLSPAKKKITCVEVGQYTPSLDAGLVESDTYLTANETSSSVSTNSLEKFFAIPPAVGLIPGCGRGEADDKTVLNDSMGSAADKIMMSKCVPAVSLEVEESRSAADETKIYHCVSPPKLEVPESQPDVAETEVSHDEPLPRMVVLSECQPDMDETNDSQGVPPRMVVTSECQPSTDETSDSQGVPLLKMNVPVSRRITVLLSYVESPGRFWVNVALEETAVVDRVTEVLNSDPSTLVPVDARSGGIELHRCYCAESVADGLRYRAEVVEICYGDDRCKRGVSDSATCQCDQLMRPSLDAIKAVRVLAAFVLLVL